MSSSNWKARSLASSELSLKRFWSPHIDKVHIIVYIIYMTQVIPVTQARRELLKLIDQVDSDYTRIDFTKNGKIKATLISPDYLDSLEETIFTLENSMDDIKKAEKEIAKGDYITLEELKEDLKKRQMKNVR